MIKRLILAVVLLALVVGGIVGFNLFRDRMIAEVFAGMEPPPVTVSVIEAEPVTWHPGLEAIGTARAAQGVDLAMETGGVVEEVLFTANDRVEAGEPLVQLDDAVQQADLAAAEAELALRTTELERAETLRERGISTGVELDVAEAAATSARSQVEKLTALVEQKALRAPFDGVIGIPRVEAGEYVAPGTIMATLQDLDRMRVDFSLPEQQIRLVEMGIPVTVFSEVGSTELRGQVIGIEPKIDPNSRLVDLRAEVENAAGEINPGQFLRVRVELPDEDGVIALPQTAVTTNLYGDSVYVVRQEGEGEEAERTVEQVFVEVGRRSEGLVEIIGGVEPGERVVTAGQNRLSSGARVTIDNSVNPVTALSSASAG